MSITQLAHASDGLMKHIVAFVTLFTTVELNDLFKFLTGGTQYICLFLAALTAFSMYRKSCLQEKQLKLQVQLSQIEVERAERKKENEISEEELKQTLIAKENEHLRVD
jgi:hypothetical protein